MSLATKIMITISAVYIWVVAFLIFITQANQLTYSINTYSHTLAAWLAQLP